MVGAFIFLNFVKNSKRVMARVSYVNEISHPELQEVIQVIREQRRGKLIPVYGLLLHSPEVAKTWMELLNAVRWKTTLSSRIREIAIIREAVLNHCRYDIDVHLANFAKQDGLTDEECLALLQTKVTNDVFSESDLAIIHYVDTLTMTANVEEAVFKKVKQFMNEREIVEISVLVGTYNMHTRVFNALQIDPEDSK